jgi:hypothetical protein
MKRILNGFAIVALLFAGNKCLAQRIADVPIVQNSMIIDGILSDVEKAECAETSMTLIGGYDKPENPTNIFLARAPDGFYIGFECVDKSPQLIVSKVKKTNGAVFTDDSVEVVFTPQREANRQNYYHLSVNAAGVPYSNYMATDRPVTGWRAASHISDKGWSAEILIPLASVNATPSDVQWRMNLARNRPSHGGDHAESSAWVDPGTTLHNYRKFGYLMIGKSRISKAREMMQENLPKSTTGTVSIPSASQVNLPATANVNTSATMLSGQLKVTSRRSTGTSQTSAVNPVTTSTIITSGTSALYH